MRHPVTVRRTLDGRSLLYPDARGNPPSTILRLFRLLCVLLLAAATAGCAKLVYNRLDTLAAWYVGHLVSLDDQQRSNLRAWLAQTLEWHRESELGRYAAFLRELSSEVAQPSGRATYQRALDRVEGFAADFTAQTAPQAASLLMELSPAQVEEFLANLEEKSNERSADEPRRDPRRHVAGEPDQERTATGEALDRHQSRKSRSCWCARCRSTFSRRRTSGWRASASGALL